MAMQTISSNPYLKVHYKRAVGVFPDRKAARQALYDLRASGFPMAQVSLIVRDTNSTPSATQADKPSEAVKKAEEGGTVGALSGVALGSLTGLLVGLGTLALPGIGPVMMAGATATAIATTLAGGAIGAVAGGLLGALIGLGIPETHAKLYHDRVAQGDCLIIVDGTDSEIAVVEEIVRHHGVEEFRVYAKPATDEVAPIPAASPSSVKATQVLPSRSVQHPSPYQSGGIDFVRNKYGIGVFSDRRDAELAINDLRLAQVPLSQVCLITQQTELFSFFTDVAVRDRIDAMRLGMPVERARFYNDQLNQANLILMINGTEQELHQAAAILNQRDIQAWQMYDPTAIDATISTEPDPSPTPTPSPPPSSANVSTSASDVVSLPELVRVVEPPPVETPPQDVLPTPSGSAQSNQEAMVVFKTLQQAEAALTKLQAVNFPMEQASILAKYHAAKIPAKLGHLVVGIGKLDIPKIGSVLVGGAIATKLVAAALAEGATATTKGLTNALVERGVSSTKAEVYNNYLLQGSTLIIVNGAREELLRAEAVLQPEELSDWDVYPSPDLN
jgi:hypothetical protein